MNYIIHIIRHTARAATVLLLALLTAQTAWAQDLSVLKVFDEVPTVTSGQSSNWNEDMENGEADHYFINADRTLTLPAPPTLPESGPSSA